MLSKSDRIARSLESILQARAELCELDREPEEAGDWIDRVRTAEYRLQSAVTILLEAYGKRLLAEHLAKQTGSVETE